MKIFILLSVLSSFLLSSSDCSHKKQIATKYKGRLEIKGICMNYTIGVLEGEMDTAKIEATWTDETTNKMYEDVFGLASPCTFPATIKEKDEFWFVIDDSTRSCMVCEAYYPTPGKKLAIKVVDQ